MKLHALLVVLAAGLLVAADAPKDDAGKKEQEKLQGKWSAVSGERDGQKAPDTEIGQIKLEFKDGKMFINIANETKEIATLKVDGSKKPKTVDLDLTEGPDKGKKAQGIYEVDGDNLKLCVAKPGKDRPTEFATKAGSETTLLVLKKDKS